MPPVEMSASALSGGVIPADDPTFTRETATSLAASLLLHLLAGLVLALAPLAISARLAEEDIAVDLLTPEQYAAISPPSAREADRVPVTPPVAPAMIRPTTMLSAAALADPASAKARKEFASLAGDERMVQLCDLEGLEQVRAWRKDMRSERLVAYATAELRIVRDTIHAEGAAIQNREGWRRIRFDCQLSPDHEKVVAFAFQLGDPIPASEWEADGLPAGHESGDED